MKTIHLDSLYSTYQPFEKLIKRGESYFVIGIEPYSFYDKDTDEEKIFDELDVFRLTDFGAEITLLGVVKNPKYADVDGHMLQVALVKFKED